MKQKGALALLRAASRGSIGVAAGPQGPDPLLERGRQLHRSGRLDEAEALYRKVLAFNPGSVAANAALAELLLQRGNYPAAIACLDLCVAAAPKNAEYLNNLGYAHILNNTQEFGLPHLLKAAKLAPKNWRILANVGRAFAELGRAEKGLPWLERAFALAPTDTKLRFTLASVLAQVGEFDRAKAIYRDLLREPSSAPGALRGLAHVGRQSSADNALDAIERHLARADLNERQRQSLHQAAAKTHLDLGNVDEAFHHFLTLKRLEALKFDIDRFEDTLASLRSLYTADYLASRSREGDVTSEPIFIVGMPRSGSTLLEQIVSSHSKLVGMGERPYISTIARRLGYGSPHHAETIRNLPPHIVREIAKGYMSLARTAADERTGRTVDKFLHNFLHIGLIRLLFPRAKILHARRDPMDCCFSMFTSPLTEGHAYTRDLTTLGRYYRAYARLMEYWSAEFPGLILDVDYERTVSDLEGSTRRVLDFLGLPWEESCLRFTENQRAVATISRWQVRQPLYRTSIERWRPYEKHLQPLMDALGLLENGGSQVENNQSHLS